MENLFEKELAKSTVFIDKNKVSPHYSPSELPFRDDQMKSLSGILVNALQHVKPDNLFIYGKTGVGKTSVVNAVLKQLREIAEEKKVNVSTVYVNCRNHASKYRSLLKCVKEMYPGQTFIGYSAGFVHEKLIDYVKTNNAELIVVLDEIDKVKDLDDLVYALTRSNDEIEQGHFSLIGISNNMFFKDRLDPRTKSSLCEKELVFSPYNAEELKTILKQRVGEAFKPDTVTDSAINLAAAIAAKESGDARTALLLLLRAGEHADAQEKTSVSDEEVLYAKTKVEEEVILNMVSTLPVQEQLVLYAIAKLGTSVKGIKKLSGVEEQVLLSGEVYDTYQQLAKEFDESPVSARWYREYINEMEMYGMITTTASGEGQRGKTTFIKLCCDAELIKGVLKKELSKTQ
jgi:archaeal cell division control protein 6